MEGGKGRSQAEAWDRDRRPEVPGQEPADLQDHNTTECLTAQEAELVTTYRTLAEAHPEDGHFRFLSVLYMGEYAADVGLEGVLSREEIGHLMRTAWAGGLLSAVSELHQMQRLALEDSQAKSLAVLEARCLLRDAWQSPRAD